MSLLFFLILAFAAVGILAVYATFCAMFLVALRRRDKRPADRGAGASDAARRSDPVGSHAARR
ncbi:hypothetical protein [Rhodococcus kronopolitis]|uniref:Uncharacterized protein n=1 Tax=Rhodococcus kronopolitis TaxID=1460226 RepID=A0ABV9FJQ0_9NOCA